MLQLQDFLREYETRTDEELLRLALEREKLTEDASRALSSELVRRGLSGDEKLREFQAEEENDRRQLDRNTGLLILTWNGFGRSRFCKWDRKLARHAGFEEYTTTVFVVLFWMPLIPTGTFRVRSRNGFGARQMQVIERLPINWAQVVMVWAATLSLLLAVAITLRYLG